MTTKSDFTPQEWEAVLRAPVQAGTYIIISDVSVTAIGRELKGLLKAVLAQEAPADAQDLVAAVVADYTAKAERKEELEAPQLDNDQDPRQQIMDQLKQDLSVLDGKTTAAEKAGFCAWLLEVAQATAEAGREGGFLGIGSVRVSDLEQAALEELRQVFGPA